MTISALTNIHAPKCENISGCWVLNRSKLQRMRHAKCCLYFCPRQSSWNAIRLPLSAKASIYACSFVSPIARSRFPTAFIKCVSGIGWASLPISWQPAEAIKLKACGNFGNIASIKAWLILGSLCWINAVPWPQIGRPNFANFPISHSSF